MNINIEQSLSYFKKDPNCHKAYWSLFKISFLSLIPFIGAIIVSITYCGYAFILTNTRIFKPQDMMPQWNFKKIFGVGIKYALFSLLISIILFPITLIINIATKDISQTPIGFTIFILFYLLYIIFLDLAIMLYTTNLRFNSFFNFKAMKFILINNFNKYIGFSIIKMGIILAYTALIIISLITIIGPIFLIPFLTFTISDLNAQFIRQIFKTTPKKI